MKILVQDKSRIVEFPREVWEVMNGNNGYIILGNSYLMHLPYGIYATQERAKEIIIEMANALKLNNPLYEMPEK